MQRENDNLFNKWCWQNGTAICKRMKLDQFFSPYKNINSKWIKDLNMIPETTKFLEENIDSNCSHLSRSNLFLDISPEARETKAKINCWNYIKIKIFCIVKQTINKPKRQPIEWEKIFAKDISAKRLVSKIEKELTKLNTPKTPSNPIKNGKKTWIDLFPKKTHRWPTDSWKDHSSSGKCKSKLQWDITSHISEWLISTTQETTGVGEDMEKKEPSRTVGGNANRCSHCGKWYGGSSKS